MATQSNRLDNASTPEFVRSFGNGLKNSDFSPNAPVRASQRGATSGDPNTPEETNSSESRIVLAAENDGLNHCSDAKHTFGVPSKEPEDNSVTEIDFAELKDGTLVELVEDQNNPGRTCFAVWKDREVRFVDRLEQDGQVFVPLARNNEVLGRLRLPSAVLPYESVQVLLRGLESLISQCIAVDEQYLSVLADFVLSTWFVDRFSVAPYLSVVGLPQSGKTTLLKVLSLVCRRSLLIADVTSASFYHACTRFMPTMLIDETATVANDRSLRHILRAGTTRDVVAVRRNHTFHSYGVKVISWLEQPNDPALNSRCILIPMFESKSTALVRTDEPAIQQLAAELQAQLLQFRFENYKRVQPAPIPGDEVLRPRTRDLLRSLTAAHVDPERSQRLLQFFESGECVPAEPLPPEHNAVLRALFSAIHIREDFPCLWISDLTQRVNIFLELAGEKVRLQPRKVGAVLTSLGFSSRTRTNSGWVISLAQRDAEKLHHLAASYGIDGIRGRDEFQIFGIKEGIQIVTSDKCGLCLAAGVNKNEPGPEEGVNRVQRTRLGTLLTRFRRATEKREE